MDAFIGTIMGWAPNFAPQNWAFCAGQSISVAQNQALYSLLGTIYGGNGTTTFNLPDLRGRVPLGAGQGPGLSLYQLGQVSGFETVTLGVGNLPPHTHAAGPGLSTTIAASTSAATTNAPGSSSVLAAANGQTEGFDPVTVKTYAPSSSADTTLHGGAVTGQVAPTGSGMPFGNMQPYLGINFIICMFGIYPPRD